MRLLAPLLLALVVAIPAHASVNVHPSPNNKKKIDITATREPFTSVLDSLGFYLTTPIRVSSSRNPLVTYSAKQIDPAVALRAIAKLADMRVTERFTKIDITDARELAVTLDVKDGEAGDILRAMQSQCAIRNLVIDPGVSGKGTFLFNGVPCRQAFDIVLRTLGLEAQTYSDALVTVGQRDH